MLLILQARLKPYIKCELPDVQVGFRKAGRIKDQIANIRWIMEKARECQKSMLFCFMDDAKGFDCVGPQQTVENYSRDGDTSPPDLPPEKSVCRSRDNSQNWTWAYRLVPNQERSTSRLFIVTLLL